MDADRQHNAKLASAWLDAIPGGWLVLSLLAVRVVFLLLGEGLINGDGTIYVKAAQEIVATGKLPPARWQSLGFAVMLAPVIWLLGPKAIGFAYDVKQLYYGDAVANTVHALYVAMDLAILLILLHEARRLLGERAGTTGATAAFAFLALQPFTAAMSTYAYPDHACMFFFFVGGWLLWRGLAGQGAAWQAAVGSLLLGLAALARIDMIPVCGALLICAWALSWQRLSRSALLRAAALGGAMFLLPLIAVSAFQYRSTGEIGYVRSDTTQNATNLRGGYFAWLRTWVVFVQGDMSTYHNMEQAADWAGFDIATLPRRATGGDAERTEIAGLLAAWKSSGYTPQVDAGFRKLAETARRERPIRTFVLVPAARMIHYWINLEGARAIHVTLRMEPPWSRVATALAFPFRVLFVVLAVLGIWHLWITLRADILRDSDGMGFARLCSLMMALRTGELGLLGIFVVGGLMETRYVIGALPGMLLLAVLGWRQVLGWWDEWQILRKAPIGA